MFKTYIFIISFILSLCSVTAQNSEINQITNSFNKGQVILEENNFDPALIHFKAGLEKSKEIKSDSLIGLGNFYLGNYFLKKKEYSKSLEYYNTALVIFEDSKDLYKESECHRKICNIYRKRSDNEKALFSIFKSLKINEQLNNQDGFESDLIEIGSIYSRTRDFDSAESHLLRAISLNQSTQNQQNLVSAFSNLGAVKQRTKNFKEAIDYYEKSLIVAKKLNLKKNEAILLGNLGSTNRSLGNYSLSLDYLFKALVLKKELKRDGSTAHTCSDIAETYMEMKEYAKAKQYAMDAVYYAQNENLELERYAYFVAGKAAYRMGDYKSSYDNMRLYSWLNDSVFNIDKTESINELQIQYESEKQQLKIQAQETDIAFLDEKNKVKNQLLLFGGLGFLGIFGFILLYRSRSTARKRELLQEKFSQDLIRAQEDERNRVAKDLHDSVGQQLTLLKKKAQNLGQEELAIITNTALEEVRGISRALYPTNLKLLGLSESIEQLLYDLDEVSDMFFTVEIDNINNIFNEEQGLNFYRFIQEAVNNVLKHAKTKTLLVTIEKTDTLVDVLIKDNGLGFDDANALRKKSLGLKTMSERIRMLKGNLLIKSQKGEGTTISAKIVI